MQRNNEYSFGGKVRFSEIDHTEKMTLPSMINYFQDCSTFQSELLGLGVDYLKEHQREQINLIFDMVVPHDYDKEKQIELKKYVREQLKEIDYRYQCVITTERSYVANAKK